jgi:glycosidase
MVLPGQPWIYYGQEIGMLNGPGGQDEHKRLPMQWKAGAGVGFTSGTPWMAPQSEQGAAFVDSQLADPDSLLAHYRALIRLRRSEPALMRGGTAVVDLGTAASSCLALIREHQGERVVLVFNFQEEATAIELSHPSLLAGETLQSIWGGGTDVEVGADGVVNLGDIPGQRLIALKAPAGSR